MAQDGFVLKQGDSGPRVEDLQIALAGFGADVWDGVYGPRTEEAVTRFQRAFLNQTDARGMVDELTRNALINFEKRFAIDWPGLACPCGECGGFGRARFRGEYREGAPRVERYHCYEYPGIHRALPAALRAASWYLEQEGWGRPVITSGYRCWEDNARHGRTSTNHMGKAVDWILPGRPEETCAGIVDSCDRVRALLAERCGFQIGWRDANRISLEPSNLAPTWIHMDLRNFEPRYLEDRFFVRDMKPTVLNEA